jgi:hypothetical protein
MHLSAPSVAKNSLCTVNGCLESFLNPTQALMSGYSLPSSSKILEMRSSIFYGTAGPAKNSLSFLPFSGVSGGYQEMSAGYPSKRSGMKTQYGCSWSPVVKMLVSCSIYRKKLKMS